MITDPAAIKFCNESVRPLADAVARVEAKIQLFQAVFAAKGLASVIPNDATVVADGSDTDGRTPMSGADVHLMLALAADLLAMASGPGSKMPTVLKVAVNPA